MGAPLWFQSLLQFTIPINTLLESYPDSLRKIGSAFLKKNISKDILPFILIIRRFLKIGEWVVIVWNYIIKVLRELICF